MGAHTLRAHILAGPARPEIGASFDVDGTLIDGVSALVFYRTGCGTARSTRSSWPGP